MVVSTSSSYPSNHATEPEFVVDDGIPTNDHVGDVNNEENAHTKRQLRGAAAAGGVAGLILGGPLLAAAAAAGGAYVVTDKGKVGDAARNCGDAMADFGVSIKRWNRNNQVTQNATKSVSRAADWAAKRLKPKEVPPANVSTPGNVQ